MRTLMVLCAGNRMRNNVPLCLNYHPDGTLLAKKAIEGIFPETYDRIIYVITKKNNKLYEMGKQILGSLREFLNVEVIELEKETTGPADTVYCAVQNSGLTGELVIRDSLNYIRMNENQTGNFITGLDVTKFQEEVFKIRTKSFIVINEQNQVLDIIEKKLRSDVISVGTYGFNSVNDFVMAYERLSDPNYSVKTMYLSHVISYLIGYKNRVFHCEEVDEHEDWGSEESWLYLQRKYGVS